MLNKQGPNKIDYCDYTLNVISGYCWHECPYCYMRPLWKRFPDMAIQKFKPEYLNRLPKKPSVIFMGSSSDMFGEWVLSGWIQQILNVAAKEKNHKFLFLTKNPHRYGEFSFTSNCWVGTTVDGTSRTENNIDDLLEFTNGHCHINRFVSFEPLLGPVVPDLWLINWVVIGADSNKNAVKPRMEWASDIIHAAEEKSIPVWMKDNYGYHNTNLKQRPF